MLLYMVFVDSAISVMNFSDKWYEYGEILVDKRNKYLQITLFKEFWWISSEIMVEVGVTSGVTGSPRKLSVVFWKLTIALVMFNMTWHRYIVQLSTTEET